jgi:hypothetical protein
MKRRWEPLTHRLTKGGKSVVVQLGTWWLWPTRCNEGGLESCASMGTSSETYPYGSTMSSVSYH